MTPKTIVSSFRGVYRAGALVVAVLVPAVFVPSAANAASSADIPVSTNALARVDAQYGQCHRVSVSSIEEFCVRSVQKKSATLTTQQLARLAEDSARSDERTSSTVPATTSPPIACNFGGSVFVRHPDRFTSCTDSTWWLTAVTYENGVPIPKGTLTGDDYQWISYNSSSLAWDHNLVDKVGQGTGVLDQGIAAEVRSGCNFGACIVKSAKIPDGTPITLVPLTNWSNEWTEADAGSVTTTANSADQLDSFLGVQVVVSLAGFGSFTLNDYGFGLVGRCDNLIPGRKSGCVDEAFTPTLVYDATAKPKVGPVAQNIYDAQNGDLATPWGKPSNPLTRTMSQKDIKANRDAACGNVIIPRGQSCDEYPMASTYQGASFQSDYTIAIVPRRANNSQGGTTVVFYGGNRVISHDPFLVLAILPDGTPSW